MELSKVERWILANQFQILEKLYPDEADSYSQMREIVESGYEIQYEWISEHIYENDAIMTTEDCLFVHDTLDMFSQLKRAYEELEDQSDLDTLRTDFRGFDGNNETKYMGYVHFLIERQGKFEWLNKGDRFNSHMPIIPVYRRMLTEWENSADRYNLKKDDIKRITAAAKAP